MAPRPQTSCVHGLMHRSLKHDRSNGQSSSTEHSFGLGTRPSGIHSMCGFPTYSEAHEHLARCPLDTHCAFTPHGSARQASIHCPRMQRSVSGQSLSVRHPSTTIGLHWPFSSTNISDGQAQIIVLSGSVSTTVHDCCLEHGLITVHGLAHKLLIQACCEGQSPSVRHTGSGSSRAHSTYGLPLVPGAHSHVA